jgi:hypothetical protein
MVFPPGQGKYGDALMAQWRRYLEEYAEGEENSEKQILVGGYHSAEIFGALSLLLDREERYRPLIEQRIGYFREGSRRADGFEDALITATFTLYNHLNTLCRQFAGDNPEASQLIAQVDAAVKVRVASGGAVGRAAEALRAAFPLLSLLTLYVDQGRGMADTVRQIEQRFAAGDGRAKSEWDQLLNALYRFVEMMQLFVILSDGDLRDQVQQIATRFKEEDETPDLRLKLRNGFCRVFELGHLVTTHLDEVLPA